MIKPVTLLLLCSSMTLAHARSSNCEEFQLSFYNQLPSTVKVVNATVNGATIVPVEFTSMAPNSKQTYTLRGVTSDIITAHYEFETQGEYPVNINVDFDLTDAYFLRCSHQNNTMKNQNGVKTTSSRGYGSVSYTLK